MYYIINTMLRAADVSTSSLSRGINVSHTRKRGYNYKYLRNTRRRKVASV
jgi:hypothetical protein